MPISEKRLAANRANAAKSTGPRTAEGKARSACNARKHGFTASSFTVVRLEDLNEIANLTLDLTTVYQPVNSQEQLALERMALAQQAMLRAARLESGLFTACLDGALNGAGTPFVAMCPELTGGSALDGDPPPDIEITHAQNLNYGLAESFQRMTRQANGWALFLRYQAQTERLYRRALEEFDRLKALRPELRNEAIDDIQPEEKEPPSATPAEPNPAPSQSQSPAAQATLPVPGEQPASRSSKLHRHGKSKPVAPGRRRPPAHKTYRRRVFPTSPCAGPKALFMIVKELRRQCSNT